MSDHHHQRSARVKPGNKRVQLAPAERQGPASDGQSLGQRFQAYVNHHRSSAVDALQRLLRVPGQSLPTSLVIAIALALPALLYLGLTNMERQAAKWQAPAQLSVFLHKRANGVATDRLLQQLSANPGIRDLKLITAEQALAEFQAASGFGDVLADLDENPLPAVVVVTPTELTVPELAQLRDQLASLPIVDSVLLDLEWVARLQQLVALIERVVLALAGLLAVGVILIVGNVIRLAISQRRDEIVIAKLVGASDGFVRRPFLYTGLWYGFFGGLLALVMLLLGHFWLAQPVAKLAALYGSQFTLSGLGVGGAISLVLLASVLGCLGAWLSVSRHLAAIKPT